MVSVMGLLPNSARRSFFLKSLTALDEDVKKSTPSWFLDAAKVFWGRTTGRFQQKKSNVATCFFIATAASRTQRSQLLCYKREKGDGTFSLSNPVSHNGSQRKLELLLISLISLISRLSLLLLRLLRSRRSLR